MENNNKSTFDLLNELKFEADSINEKKNYIFSASDSTRFIESYIIELIEFYNKRYTEYDNITFRNIRPYIPFLKIKKMFIFDILPLSLKDFTQIIKSSDEDLALLIENTDLVKKFEFPINVLDEASFNRTDYLKSSLDKALNLNNVKTLISFSKTLFIIPPEIDFITIFFNKNQLMFKTYFETVNINPLGKKAIQLIGEDKEIYRNGEVMHPDNVMSIENLAAYHKKTKRRNIDALVQEYIKFYELITNSDNYTKLRQYMYNYALERFPALCYIN